MTELLYLGDSYLFESAADVLDIVTLEDGRTAIVLDKTIFYPQGGGQPCDTGTIRTNESKFLVTDVRMQQQGRVYHIGTFELSDFKIGDSVKLSIDKERRILNTKLHSAGHLLDCAVIKLDLKLKPSKGYHFPEGPYVEYEGEIANAPELIIALQQRIDLLISSGMHILAEELSSEQAEQQNLQSPLGKKVRIVTFENFKPCGCGGTHVTSVDQLGSVLIRKIKSKGGITRISYEIK